MTDDDATDYVNDPTTGWRSPLLLVSDVDCYFCGESVGLFARVEGKVACSRCWARQGRPFPRFAATPAEIHAAELAIRERMQKRGGADRHMVRAGKS